MKCPTSRETAAAAALLWILGIGLAIASIIVMPAVAWGKLRAAAHLGSSALLMVPWLVKEGREGLSGDPCGYD